MPELDQAIVRDVEQRLGQYLQKLDGYGSPEYVRSGGSAAVFKVEGPSGPRAFKVFNPKFFEGERAAADRKRLEVQRSTIGHTCPSLIQTFRVEEAEGTAIMEMEYLAWPSLDKQLALVPDDNIVGLISQLVSAVRILEAQNIVHRDIKPENIHISPDFTHLKLLDLGVARIMESEEEADAGITDHGITRPFLATAQYSSPEYLFRLDKPSAKLWKGLNFYQVGAVLHDLIMKRPIFDDEMQMNNRWLVAKAVLSKQPSFAEEKQDRLLHLKALSSKCLTKDLDSRLNLVGWDDFQFADKTDPRTALAERLFKKGMSAGEHAKHAAAARLSFDRTEFLKRLATAARNELIPVCKAALPMRFILPDNEEKPAVLFNFAAQDNTQIECLISIEWLKETYERWANVFIQTRICHEGHAPAFREDQKKCILNTSIGEGESQAASELAKAIAMTLGLAMDIFDVHSGQPLTGGRIVQLN